MACTLSTMSCKRRRGFSEGKSAIPVDLFLQALFAHRLFDYIHLAGEDCRQPVLEVLYAAEVVEAGLGEALAQAHSHIDIVSWILAPRHRAKQGDAHHTRRAQFRFMRLQSGDDPVAFHDLILPVAVSRRQAHLLGHLLSVLDRKSTRLNSSHLGISY